MKICQIVASVGQGGLEKHVIELSKYLNKKDGIELTVIAHESFRKELEGINFQAFDLTKSRKNIFLLFKLYKYLKAQNFDIIHTQANKATAMISMLKPFLQSKIVATLHNKKSNLKPFEKVDHVITVSKKIGENLKTQNKTVVYNGINLSNNSVNLDLNTEFNIPKGSFVISGVGRLVKAKRFDLIISSLVELKDIYFVLVGAGEDEFKLKDLSKKLNVSNRVIFTGNVTNEKAKSIIRSSDLYVLSSDKEGFGYVFAEALCEKTPLISTDVADVKLFISDKYIIPFNNHKVLSKKINEINNNYKNVLEDFEDNIFNNALKSFSLNEMIKNVIEVYKKVLK